VAYAWGSNTFGQLGQGDLIDRLNPVAVSALSSHLIVSVASRGTGRSVVWLAGTASALVEVNVTDSGRAFAVGTNTMGQLGLGDTSQRNSPTEILSIRFTALTAGPLHFAGIAMNGSLYGWGRASTGAFGFFETEFVSRPTSITFVHSAAVRTIVACETATFVSRMIHDTLALTLQSTTVTCTQLERTRRGRFLGSIAGRPKFSLLYLLLHSLVSVGVSCRFHLAASTRFYPKVVLKVIYVTIQLSTIAALARLPNLASNLACLAR
jgi:hypothetical protein